MVLLVILTLECLEPRAILLRQPTKLQSSFKILLRWWLQPSSARKIHNRLISIRSRKKRHLNYQQTRHQNSHRFRMLLMIFSTHWASNRSQHKNLHSSSRDHQSKTISQKWAHQKSATPYCRICLKISQWIRAGHLTIRLLNLNNSWGTKRQNLNHPKYPSKTLTSFREARQIHQKPQ